ncbi:YceK/YidQ family lipoprotein [Aeromonas bivalvium]|uniref:YceK/YidQ family lipoprotein n=1 Tax=Aeromonas bivalvium TaxID=440079 RepID=UPI0038D07D94
MNNARPEAIGFSPRDKGVVMRVLAWVVLCLSLSGCATITSRMGEDSTWGHPYSSVQTAADNGAECIVVSVLGAPPLLLFTIPITLVDMGSALVVDTVMLPIDLAMTPDEPDLKTPRSLVCHYDYKI